MMAGYLVRQNAELQDRVRKLEESVQILRGMLRQLNEVAVADTRPGRYVLPVVTFDAIMHAAGLRAKPAPLMPVAYLHIRNPTNGAD